MADAFASTFAPVSASFRVVADVTTAEMAFDPPELRIGNVCVGETAETSLRVTNRGALMAAGCGLTGVDVAPARFGEILPGETRDVRVRFAPKRVGRREFKVTVKSLLGAREFAVPCAGWGVFPPSRRCRFRTHAPADGACFGGGIGVSRNPSDVRWAV